ncbi:Sec-independent protein translocase protein TatB [Acidithiobacillus sp. AMEEHan]|uniref:Sec-independent protein translocase protein TatB n=1 Tax=Acidithiobacillus sp. AMEEHan TaxID=2994951 RepID=UPI0027E4548A|nr:Sec-independent protein translocase protein TatB [Acidithiobacillus sp. AMEEHan]
MFDFSFGELALLAVIALLVVGPEKLPELARTAGKWVGYFRRTVNNVRSEVEQQLLLDEMRKEAEKLKGFANEPLQEVEKFKASIEEPLLAEGNPIETGTQLGSSGSGGEPEVTLPPPSSSPSRPQDQTLH